MVPVFFPDLLFLAFSEAARKTTKKPRIFFPCRTLKIPGKEGKNTQKKEFLARKKSKEFKKNTERKIRVWVSLSRGLKTLVAPSLNIICVTKRTSPRFYKSWTHWVWPQTQWGSVSSLLWNSALETPQPFPTWGTLGHCGCLGTCTRPAGSQPGFKNSLKKSPQKPCHCLK